MIHLIISLCLSASHWYPLKAYSHYISAIDYIQFLMTQKNKQEDDLDGLRKEVMALKIMKA